MEILHTFSEKQKSLEGERIRNTILMELEQERRAREQAYREMERERRA